MGFEYYVVMPGYAHHSNTIIGGIWGHVPSGKWDFSASHGKLD